MSAGRPRWKSATLREYRWSRGMHSLQNSENTRRIMHNDSASQAVAAFALATGPAAAGLAITT